MAADGSNQITFDELIKIAEEEIAVTLDRKPVILNDKSITSESVPKIVDAPKKKEAKKVEKPVLNPDIKEIWNKVDLFSDLEIFGVFCDLKVLGNNITLQNNDDYTLPIKSRWYNAYNDLRTISNTEPYYIYYVDENSRVWEAYVKLDLDRVSRTISIREKSDWKINERFHEKCIGCYQTNDELLDILKEVKPWTYKYFFDERHKENGYKGLIDPEPLTILAAPELESLIKAGYVFAEKYVAAIKPLNKNSELDQGKLDSYNRLIKRLDNPGKLKNIFKTSQVVCKVLKSEADIFVWDNYRKMDKFGRLGNNEIQLAYDARLSKKQLDQISSILGRKYENKQVFTFPSLMTYLQRVDMYEAIGTDEALILIDDYLRQCQSLNIKPKIDGDSLKREHDVVSRNYRIASSVNRNAADKLKEKNATDNLRKYDYEEDLFFIRGIRSHEDLLNEANQQHNCVASYYHRILSGTSLIFVMREKRTPNTSLVTIELSPDGSTIKQKFLAYNRPIHNAAQTEFIKRWHKHVRDVMKGIEKPMVISESLNGYYDHLKSNEYDNAYVYGIHHSFGYGMQPMENLLYQGTDPDGKFKAILKYSYPVKDSDLKKYSMELLSAGERKTAPVHHINRNQGMER